MAKQSSPELSSLAAKLMSMTDAELLALAVGSPAQFYADVRSLAASVLSQDETPAEPETADIGSENTAEGI